MGLLPAIDLFQRIFQGLFADLDASKNQHLGACSDKPISCFALVFAQLCIEVFIAIMQIAAGVLKSAIAHVRHALLQFVELGGAQVSLLWLRFRAGRP